MATANYSSWPDGNPPQQGHGRMATVVDTDPPESFSAWPDRHRLPFEPPSWPNKKLPQRRQRRPVTPSGALAPHKARPVGGWIVVFSFCAFAAGLSAAPALSFYGDRAVEAAVPWMVRWAPSAVRPYLPKPLEPPKPPMHPAKHAKQERPAAVEPAASPEQPVKHSRTHRSHGKHGMSATPANHASQTDTRAGDPFDQ